MRRKDRPPIGRRPATQQLDLFPHGMSSGPEPTWETLPEDTRERLTTLIARLLLDHQHGDRRAAGGERDV